ncbi:MAG: hypothetical protein AAF939_02160 [Planctomycetota bacterium]
MSRIELDRRFQLQKICLGSVLVLAFFSIFVPAKLKAQSAQPRAQETLDRSNVLFAFMFNNPLDLKFFLEEFNIVDDQKMELENLRREFVGRWL